MKSFFYLVNNEIMKIYKRPGAWVFLGLILLINLLFGLIVRRLFVDASLPFWDFIDMSSNLLLIIQLIVIVYAGDILSNEFSRGTIKMLLMRPYSRSKILFSKLIAILFLVIFFTLFQFTSSVLAGILFFSGGFTLFGQSFLFSSSSYLFQFIEIVIIGLLAFTLSVITRSSIFSITVTIFLFYFSSLALALLEHFGYENGKYILFANTNLQPYFFGEPMFDGMTLYFSIINVLFHCVICLIISFGLFNKRDIHV